MSLSIENLSFTIWGNGHDATLLDSGDGEVQIFSHPFVPLNSINYAGQYYFLAPDEDGVMFDVVKDDVAHCTFTPALGASFDTEGEVTVTVNYHREYIHDEETIIVDKTVSQKIMVVDHGSIVTSGTTCDLYTDGYLFIRPADQQVYGHNYTAVGSGTKCSSIPWRATSLTNTFSGQANLADITELEFVDTSNLVALNDTFRGCKALTDFAPLKLWDVSNVTYMNGTFRDCWGLTSLEGLEKWNTSNVTMLVDTFRDTAMNSGDTDISALADWDTSKVDTMQRTFYNSYFHDFSPLAKWDVSKVSNPTEMFISCAVTSLSFMADWDTSGFMTMSKTFYGCYNLTSLDGLQNADVSHVVELEYTFANCASLANLSALADWDVSSVQKFDHTFYMCPSLTSLVPLKNWDVSGAWFMEYMFADFGYAVSRTPKISQLHSLDGLEDWDVSHVTNFGGMFDQLYFLADISAVGNWNVSSGRYFGSMFNECCGISDIDDLSGWNVSNALTLSWAFRDIVLRHSVVSGEDYCQYAHGSYIYSDGSTVPPADLVNYTVHTFDADGANSWTVNITPPVECFVSHSGNYINIPSWN